MNIGKKKKSGCTETEVPVQEEKVEVMMNYEEK